jgi:hypothetical protein
MRLIEALEFANIGQRKRKKDLARLLWPDSSYESQDVNMSKLINGKTKRIDPGWVNIIADFCGVDANFLFLV